MTADWPARFERMYAHDEDPWQYRTRWYEARKRALTLASLPEARYRYGFEIGCSNGELAAVLAPRCDQLLACDISAQAVEIASRRLADFPSVTVQQRALPEQWPAIEFDLVVLSEVGYFFDRAGLVEVAGRLRAAVLQGATVLACHWRWPIQGGWINGDGVHQCIQDSIRMPSLGGWLDADMRIEVWCADPRSVAQRDGIVEAAQHKV